MGTEEMATVIIFAFVNDFLAARLRYDDLIQLKNVICNETTRDAMKRVTILAICDC
nr:hypothetical protein [Treponema sp.]